MAPVPEVDSINIRRVRWPSGNNLGSRALYAHEPNQDRALFYTRGDVDARRTVINLRRIQGICTLSDNQLWARDLWSIVSLGSAS